MLPINSLDPSNGARNSINILDYIEVVAKYWKMIVKVTLGVFILSVCGSLLLTNIYSSTARLLPPQQDQVGMGMMVSMMGGSMSSVASDLFGKGSPADLYIGMMNTETVSDAIINRFNLMQVYKKKSRKDAYNTLDANVEISAGKKNDIISITVSDKDPKLAADIANAYADELGKLVMRLKISDAGFNRSFLEKQLEKVKLDLARSEEELKSFQLRTKAFDITEQTKGTITGIAALTSQLAIEEVKLEALQRSMTDSSQDVKNQKTVIASIKLQIARLEGAQRGNSSIPSAGNVPSIGQEYFRLMRAFKTNEAIQEMLTKQYEMAKLNESKENSNVQVIQKASVADKKSKPKRAIIVLATTFVAFVGSILSAFVIDSLGRISSEDVVRLSEIKALLKL